MHVQQSVCSKLCIIILTHFCFHLFTTPFCFQTHDLIVVLVESPPGNVACFSTCIGYTKWQDIVMHSRIQNCMCTVQPRTRAPPQLLYSSLGPIKALAALNRTQLQFWNVISKTNIGHLYNPHCAMAAWDKHHRKIDTICWHNVWGMPLGLDQHN